MQNLTVIENDLVPVYETSTGEKVVYGSELHSILEVKSKFADWIKNRLNDCEALENEEYQSFSKTLEKGGRPQMEYIIKLDIAKEMAMLERNEKGKQVRRYFIQVEKKYKNGAIGSEQLSPELQMFGKIFEAVARQELQQKQQAEKLNQIEDKVESIKEVVALSPNDWRKDTSKLISKMALQLGGYEYINQLRAESYKYLEERMGVSLNIRLTNKRRRMADEGICKSRRDKLNQLDVIADDKKLIEGYVAIIKEMAVKYGISSGEVA